MSLFKEQGINPFQIVKIQRDPPSPLFNLGPSVSIWGSGGNCVSRINFTKSEDSFEFYDKIKKEWYEYLNI